MNIDHINDVIFSHDGVYDCESHGCNDDGICRCYKITESYVTGIYIHRIVSKIFNYYFDLSSKSYNRDIKLEEIIYNIPIRYIPDIHKYCIERVLIHNQIYLPEKWNITHGAGYYGEEVTSIKLKADINKQIQEDLKNVFNATTLTGKINFLLEQEYGFLSDKIKNRKCIIKQIDTSNLILPNKNHLEIAKANTEYFKYTIQGKIKGVCVRENDKYIVIDGYHRLSQSNGKIKILLYI